MSTSRVAWAGWFSVALPEDWSSSTDDGVITLIDEENGVGALQISVARRDRKTAIEEDARSLSTSHLSRAVAGRRGPELAVGPFGARGAVSFLDAEGYFWRVWVIVSKTRVATITYSAEEADKDTELGTVCAIVDSFDWIQ